MSGRDEFDASSYQEGAVALPLDPFIAPDPTAEARIFGGLESAMRDCMADRGYDYDPASFGEPRVPDLYGLVGRERAETSGYRPPQAPDVASEPTELPHGYGEALIGTEANAQEVLSEAGEVLATIDPSSCARSATVQIQPEWKVQVVLEAQLRAMVQISRERADDSDNLAAAWDVWSGCMRDEGVEFDTPWATYYSVWPGNEPGEEEIATAVADVECKESTGLLDVWSRELARVQSLLLEQNGDPLSEWLQMRAASLERIS